MKKLSIAALAVAGAFSAMSANASLIYSNGCVVPMAKFDATSDTVVGLTSRGVQAVGDKVYWTFFDVNSNHVADGSFPMTPNDYEGWSWKGQNRIGTSGVAGYLTFAAGTAAAAPAAWQIDCNAFQITANDAAFTPVLVAPAFVFGAPAGATLNTMNNLNLVGATLVAPAGSVTDMRYWIDGATGGRDTAVLVWSPGDMSGTYTVDIYNDKQVPASGNFTLPNKELNIFNPETMVGKPADYLEGFIRWNVLAPVAPKTDLAAGVFTYSVVSDPAFGATQTLLNPW